ncbi:MAG TPA: hypothetical protein ENJ09_12570 [Planctomycetes bacterium]|nr:hypothetical protein [Planctomycetota bacterium]
MTRTARRRWSREFQGEIDGIALGGSGPVLVHGYDPPVGGKWIDNVIPGKLAAYERGSGEEQWVSPCEVGYGRGFGCGLGPEEDIVVLGPSIRGHRIARMRLATGELLGACEIRPFDQALVFPDMCVSVTPDRISGIMTSAMLEVWSFTREGERYHVIGRDRVDGEHLIVTYTNQERKRQGVLRLDIESGDFVDTLIPPDVANIHEMAADDGIFVLLVGDRPPSRFHASAGPGKLRLEGWRADVSPGSGGHPLWRQEVNDDSPDEFPDVSIKMDSGKLYVTSGALLEVRDGLSGRLLGEMTLPGLDERIAWTISEGAGLIAEETRVSIFELPA